MPDTTPTVINLLYAGVAGFLALMGKWLFKNIQQFLSQRTPEATARAMKTEAEARQITVKSGIDAAQAINQIIIQMLETQGKLEEAREDFAIVEAENKVYEVQIKGLKALLDLHGITYELPPKKTE